MSWRGTFSIKSEFLKKYPEVDPNYLQKILDECLLGGRRMGVQELGKRLERKTIGSLMYREVTDLLKDEQ